MLGWEFPPFISGGLGTACQGLTRALVRLKASILFVLPTVAGTEVASFSVPSVRVPARTARRRVRFLPVPSAVRSPYASAGWSGPTGVVGVGGEMSETIEPSLRVIGTGAAGGYEGNLIRRITEYADRCVQMTRDEPFEIIHAHDWVTFPAGLAIAAQTGRPLVAHVHSTEFDRSGEQVNQAVYDVERAGARGAAAVIAVSHLTERILVERYGLDPAKVRVVHNGIESARAPAAGARAERREKTVLFLGRITMQKGPEFFVRAAEKVLQRMDNVKFVVAGWGDLGPRLIDMVVRMGLGRKVVFTGFLRGKEVDRAYRMADVYVMPSVSEPFGLTALEAIRHGVPVILSRNSGVAEVLWNGALKCDFWDVDTMADKILAVLNRPGLAESLRREGAREIRSLTWESAARKCLRVYEEVTEQQDLALAG